MWGHSPFELFEKGGWCMWPLLTFSVFGLAIILDRVIAHAWYWTNYPGFLRRYGPLLQAGRAAEVQSQLELSHSPLARVTLAYLQHLTSKDSLREEVVAREGSQLVAKLEKRIGWLSMVGSVATLTGLLGTVIGLVSAFYQIELKGGQVQPGDLAAGIWVALLTTVFGLSVAIPCIAAYHIFDNRAGTTALQIQWLVAYLDEWLQPGTPENGDKPTSAKRIGGLAESMAAAR